MLIYSKRYFDMFESAANSANLTPMICADIDMFVDALSTGQYQYIVIDTHIESDFYMLAEENKDFILGLIKPGLINSFTVFATDTGIEEEFVGMLEMCGAPVAHIGDSVTEAIIKRVLVTTAPSEYYASKVPPNSLRELHKKTDTNMSKLFEIIMGEVDAIPTDVADIKTTLSLREKRAEQLINELDPTSPNYPKNVRAVKTIQDISNAKYVLSNMGEIIKQPIKEYSDKLSTAESLIKDAIRQREIENVEEKIVSIIETAREGYSRIKELLTSNSTEMREIVGIVTSTSIPDLNTFHLSFKECDSLITKQEAITLVGEISSLTKIRQNLINEVGSRLQEMQKSSVAIEQGMDKVVQGYETAHYMQQSLITKLATNANIELSVEDDTQKHSVLVYGVGGTGVTNFALSAALKHKENVDGTRIAVIDAKPDAQLHYYAPNAVDIMQLVDKSINELETMFAAHYKQNETMLVSAPTLLSYVNRNKDRMASLITSIGCVMDVLSSMGVTTVVISDNNSPIHDKLLKKVAAVYLVSDTNPSNVKKLTPLLTKLIGFRNVKIKTLVITRCDTMGAATVLQNNGVKMTACRVVGVKTYTSVDLCKMSGKLYALDYPWEVGLYG